MAIDCGICAALARSECVCDGAPRMVLAPRRRSLMFGRSICSLSARGSSPPSSDRRDRHLRGVQGGGMTGDDPTEHELFEVRVQAALVVFCKCASLETQPK